MKSPTSFRAFLFDAKTILSRGAGLHLWTEVDSAINGADVRLSLAALLMQSGDWSGAELEINTAQSMARKLESPRLLRRCEELGARLTARTR